MTQDQSAAKTLLSEMSPEEITQIGIKMLDLLMEIGSRSEKDLSTIGSDPYKPLYRSITIVMGLFKDLGRGPTKEEGEAILCSAHPWFVTALKQSRGSFDQLWDSHYETWWGPMGIHSGRWE